MEKVLVSLPDVLAEKLRSFIPSRQRSRVISRLIEKEVDRRERLLYECAVAVEKDAKLHHEMKDWDVTVGDGLNDEAW